MTITSVTPADSESPAPQSPSPRSTGREVNMSYADLMKPDEDWRNLPNAADRRKIQNRLAQRAYRRSLRERNQEVQRLKKQVEKLEGSQREPGIPVESATSPSAVLPNSPRPASQSCAELTVPPTITTADWMGDYLQVWSPAPEQAQSVWGLDGPLQPLSPDVDIDIVQDFLFLPPEEAAPTPAALTRNPKPTCPQHQDINKTFAFPPLPPTPPISNHSHNLSLNNDTGMGAAFTPDFNFYVNNTNNTDGIDLGIHDSPNSFLDSPFSEDSTGQQKQHHMRSSSERSALSSLCRCKTGHTPPISASLPTCGDVPKTAMSDKTTAAPEPGPVIHGLVVESGQGLGNMTIRLQQTNLGACTKLVTLLFQYGAGEGEL